MKMTLSIFISYIRIFEATFNLLLLRRIHLFSNRNSFDEFKNRNSTFSFILVKIAYF